MIKKIILGVSFFNVVLLQADSYITDSKQSLLWLDNKNVLEHKKSWSDAQDYCKNLKVNNLKGWRLPSTDELNYAIKNMKFKHNSTDGFWTNSRYTYLPFDPWKVQDNSKNDLCCSESKVLTRCVKDK